MGDEIDKLKRRVESWGQNGPKARIAVPLGELRAVLAALSTARLEVERAGMERAAKIAEAQADLLSDMATVYPGDPTGELSEQATIFSGVAASIRAEKDGL